MNTGNSGKNKTVLVAMSGGVDSSVALYLLHKEGYAVAGATMKLWDFSEVGGQVHKDGRCCNLESINNARRVCALLGVPHYVLDFTTPFRKTVIENFVSEYRRGRTPNPCVLCNTEIKWELFLRKALSVGCDKIATGHYARTGRDEQTGRYYIKRGLDSSRDQSYALWGIPQGALARTVLPLGSLRKKETRTIAAEAGLQTAAVPESMEICFVADDNYERFIREWSEVSIPEGDIVTEEGQVLGRHKGIPFYTVGQRRGLGVAHPTPLYVKRIEVETNRVVVGEKDDLHRREMTLSSVNWVGRDHATESFPADVKIRYLHSPQPAIARPDSPTRLRIEFNEPQRAITPGQSAVLYDGDLVIAGGIID